MRHNKVIYLISTTTTLDENFNEVEEKTERKVYANPYSVSSSEYYNAAVNDLRPEKAFEIHTFEYNGEELFKFEGKEYNIIRTRSKGEKTIIVGERVAANA